jgi:hypothetical protein
MPNIAPMDPNIIIAELDDYSARVGYLPTTICQYALGNARFYDRLKKRLVKYQEEAERLRSFMAANPPAETQKGSV